MAFSRPSLAEIIDRATNDFTSRLTNGSSVLRRSVIAVWTRVLAGASHLLHGHIDWVSRQVFPDTADEAELLRWASIWGVERTPAEFATGNITFTGANGSIIPAGTELQRSDGVAYTTDAEAEISGGTATVAVTASEAGEDSNCEEGDDLSLVSPISGVQSDAEVATGGIDGGADEEDVEDLRARLMLRIQNPPQGGTEADFESWALEVAGVTRAWVYPENTGLGTVGVSFVRDNDSGSIFPSVGEVADVQEYIDERRPVTIEVTVFAPTAYPVDFEIELTGDDTAAIRSAIEAELEDLLLREGEPGGTILLSHIREAISIAAGETDHILTDPVADVTAPAGELHTMGTITWV